MPDFADKTQPLHCKDVLYVIYFHPIQYWAPFLSQLYVFHDTNLRRKIIHMHSHIEILTVQGNWNLKKQKIRRC